MNNNIAESIKNIVESSQGHMIDYEYVEEDGSIRIDKALPIGNFKDWLRVGLEAIAEKTREERLKDLLSILPRKFFEDEDHIVGGYISKKDLYELLSDKESK